MKKLGSLALVFAALCIALPTAASAHDRHGHGHGHGRGHRSHWHAPRFVPVPVPVRAYAPTYYAPAYYGAPCPPAYYPAAVAVPIAPFISVRTGRVAVSIGGFLPY